LTIFINVDYTGWFAAFAQSNNGFGVLRLGQRQMLTNANRKAVEWWHTKIIPKHFTPSARWRYHYQKRKPIYRSIKEALAAGKNVYVFGKLLPPESIRQQGRVDVVRSGSTEQKAKQASSTFASPSQATITMRVPRHITGRTQGSRPNQGKEIQSTTNAEDQQLVRIWKKTFLASFRVFGSSIIAVRRRIRRK
jgi:hypothetical protein